MGYPQTDDLAFLRMFRISLEVPGNQLLFSKRQAFPRQDPAPHRLILFLDQPYKGWLEW